MKVRICSIESDAAEEFAQKFNEINAKYFGYAPRSRELWIHTYGLGRNTFLLVAEKEENSLGYALVTIRRRFGFLVAAISELCAWGDKQKTTEALLDATELYAKKNGVDAIMMWVSVEKSLERTAKAKGFLFFGKVIVSVGILSSQFFESAMKFASDLAKAHFRRNLILEIELKEKYPTYSGMFTVEIDSDGHAHFSVGSHASPNARIVSDVRTFGEILFQIQNPYVAFIRGRLKVSPFWKAFEVLKLLTTLSNFLKWYSPLGDYDALFGS